MFYTYATTPLGKMLVAADNEALCGAWFTGQKYYPEIPPSWIERPEDPLLKQTKKELSGYFKGELKDFSLPLAPRGTEFQRKIWAALRQIPFGSTVSYSEVTKMISGSSPRAAGSAIGRNPISVIIPCHRVLGKNQSLTGYAGGLERKRELLNLEKAI